MDGRSENCHVRFDGALSFHRYATLLQYFALDYRVGSAAYHIEFFNSSVVIMKY